MEKLHILYWAVFIIGGYVLGSVMFSRDIPKLLGFGDITQKSDDKNPGAANVFKNCGVLCGSVCLFFDILKGFAPVFLANLVFGIDSVRFAVVMLVPVLGHAFPLFNRFRGGKCIATSFGALLGCIPQSYIVVLLAALYILFSVLIKINPHRIRSIVTFVLFSAVGVPLLVIRNKPYVALGCLLISAVTVLKHTKLFAEVKEAIPAIVGDDDEAGKKRA